MHGIDKDGCVIEIEYSIAMCDVLSFILFFLSGI